MFAIVSKVWQTIGCALLWRRIVKLDGSEHEEEERRTLQS